MANAQETTFTVSPGKRPAVRVVKRDIEQIEADKRTEIQTMKMFMRRYRQIAVEYSRELVVVK